MSRDCLKKTGFVIALTKKDSDYISSFMTMLVVEIVDWSQLDGGLLESLLKEKYSNSVQA